jgi:hypothetical protein
MTDAENPSDPSVPAVACDDALAEIGRDLQSALNRFMGGTVKEWRALLADSQQKYARAAWKPEGEREQVQGLLDYTRWALDAFERLGRDGPPQQDHLTPADFSWHDVSDAWRRDESAGRALVERIKAAARDELRVGTAAAAAVEGYHARPMERAEFTAVWVALADGLKPANGAERLLIDAMAQAWVMHRRWLHRMVQSESLDAIRFERDARTRGEYETPRLSEAETVDRAMMMADRFQRQFLRLLKAYRDQRRVFSTLVVAGGQVNIAADGGQQVNVVRESDD